MTSRSSFDREALPPFGTLIRVPEPELEPIKHKTLRRHVLKKTTMIRQSSQLSTREEKSRPQSQKNDTNEENGVWWWVNKNGFPIDDKTWERMWDHVAKIHPDSYKMVHAIRGNGQLPQVPYAQPPVNFSPVLTVGEKIEKIQNYMNSLQYNHTGTQFFEIRKNRPISGLMECAKDMVRESLPIKCLEAVILGIYLTNGMMGVERFTISFKTVFSGNVHRHVVLGIYYSGRYGALGMSRRDDLMYKPMFYRNLSELVLDYEKSYNKYWHEVKKIKLGLPVPHDPHSYEFIQWKNLTLNCSKLTQKEMIKDVDTFSKELRNKGLQRELDSPQYGSRKQATPLAMYSSGRKSRSWLMSHSNFSPRKSLSFIDLDAVQRSKQRTSAPSSLSQAMKVYQGNNKTPSASSTKNRESTDLGEYQIRI